MNPVYIENFMWKFLLGFIGITLFIGYLLWVAGEI